VAYAITAVPRREVVPLLGANAVPCPARSMAIYTFMNLFSGLVLLAVLWRPAVAQDRYPVDWEKLEPEILDHFTTLLKIDTTNPPGDETKAAQVVEAVLKREGIPVQLFAVEPRRANLVARLKGNGSKKPILLMGHTDVVGVQRERWSVDP